MLRINDEQDRQQLVVYSLRGRGDIINNKTSKEMNKIFINHGMYQQETNKGITMGNNMNGLTGWSGRLLG